MGNTVLDSDEMIVRVERTGLLGGKLLVARSGEQRE